MRLGFEIIGTGSYLPGKPVKNQDLMKTMDTSDDWIVQRSGIRQRHFAPDGVGASDLGAEAAKKAIAAAQINPQDIDYIIFATMTPDYVFPGSASLLGTKLGLDGIPSLDIRQQCAAMLYGLHLVDSLIRSGAAKVILFVAAETHAGFMPWTDWSFVDSEEFVVSKEQWALASHHRSIAILFGDGAGALVFRATSREAGLLGIDLHSDGRYADLLHVPGGGFRRRPYWTEEMLQQDAHIPRMYGRDLFKLAVTKLPESIQALAHSTSTSLEQIEWFLAHQANERINEYVRKKLEIPKEKMPSNIEQVGNTSGATIPILIDELTREGKLRVGDLNMVFALGAGVHWGSALLRW
ncbi:3-oxoacyl-ACP synthase III family protein [Pajaroellobacter abortibovis]|uniref:3-oxoacyl-ACP synthase n=1 Tax=Pajaroellobacter abortibovis TaxID=1882918 RepID=A0A1L6MV96_9BACT|nr:3-oxoacyl-[acyl-carrier-protein] synthase III C-terminal domain-containing protein [Pajaroellobacter abortibovis]APR99401.1 3-oxoacyl-ACP synthase [Pajaroellobacter abortibovis]